MAHGRWTGMSTLGDRFDPRDNAFSLERLMLALFVLVSHAWPLGFGRASPLYHPSHTQTELGGLGLYGFFVLSGFLVTASGLTHPVGRFTWHRFLRIFPGLWTCLVVTAFGLAPLAALHEHGNLDGFWSHPLGPVQYVATNWLVSMEQFPVAGLFSTTPFGLLNHGPSALDGSLWSLRYELACYAVIGVLAFTAVLHRARRLVLLLLVGGYLLIARDLLLAPGWTVRPPLHGAIGPWPLLGAFGGSEAIYLGSLFLLGAAARLYMHRIPMHGALAVAAAAIFVASFFGGGFIILGRTSYAYLLFYAAVALPPAIRRIARRRDYSYGVFLYSFPVQQMIALHGGARWGMPAYLLFTLAGTLLLAVPSWHLVERPALRLKHARPPGWLVRPLGRLRPARAVPAPEPRGSADAPGPAPRRVPVSGSVGGGGQDGGDDSRGSGR